VIWRGLFSAIPMPRHDGQQLRNNHVGGTFPTLHAWEAHLKASSLNEFRTRVAIASRDVELFRQMAVKSKRDIERIVSESADLIADTRKCIRQFEN
jgi:hypothetical protein